MGGVQPGYVVGGEVGSKTPFKGCIADATFNGRVLNLLEPFSNHSVTFGRCGKITTTGGVPPGKEHIYFKTILKVILLFKAFIFIDVSLWPTPTRDDVLPTPVLNVPVDEKGKNYKN